MIYIGADHRGFSLKEDLKKVLLDSGYELTDVGPHSLDMGDDYPDFAIPVAEAVAKSPKDKGILICGSGHGMDMVANKFKGVRSAIGFNLSVAKQSREHEDANVLVLPSDWVKERDAIEIVKIWLETEFGNEERNLRRIEKIKKIEV